MGSLNALDGVIFEITKAIDICASSKLLIPSLTLIYSGIDMLGWLDIDDVTTDASRKSFKCWATDYILAPGSELTCTADDLYSARCGLLHIRSSESRDTRSGSARRIFYAWGNSSAEDLQKVIDLHPTEKAVAVHFNTLFKQFVDGAMRFRSRLESDATKAAIVELKLQKIFHSTNSPDRIKELLESGILQKLGLLP
jgi:hypothetical protein